MRSVSWLAIPLLLVLVVAACGGDDDDSGNADVTATTIGDATSTEGSSATDSSDGDNFVEIDAADFAFSPDAVAVAADTDLTFVVSNTGDAPHTLDLYADEDYSEEIEGASTGSIPTVTIGQFEVALPAGEYYFRCELHPDKMTGTITAE